MSLVQTAQSQRVLPGTQEHALRKPASIRERPRSTSLRRNRGQCPSDLNAKGAPPARLSVYGDRRALFSHEFRKLAPEPRFPVFRIGPGVFSLPSIGERVGPIAQRQPGDAPRLSMRAHLIVLIAGRGGYSAGGVLFDAARHGVTSRIGRPRELRQRARSA
jgi:hypothetical protein